MYMLVRLARNAETLRFETTTGPAGTYNSNRASGPRRGWSIGTPRTVKGGGVTLASVARRVGTCAPLGWGAL